MILRNSASTCRRRHLRAAIQALLLSLCPAIDAVAQTKPNVLVVLMDDVGIEHISDFQVGDSFANTLNISAFANTSLRFQDAWSSPLCSPTRATIQTGRYGFRTGIGSGIRCQTTGQLDTADLNLLPKRLKTANYATAAFGKWHLGEEPTTCDALWGQDRPILAGYDYFDGLLFNQQPPGPTYSNYGRTKVTRATPPGCPTISNEVATTYMTDDIFDAAAAWISNAPEPWFAYVAPFAAHKPFHCPPGTSPDPYNGHVFPCTNQPEPSTLVKYRSMIEALDLDFLDILNAVKARDSNLGHTLVIVVSDNGSPGEVAQPPFEGEPVKGTVGQGGIWVPLIIGGNSVPPGVVPNGQPVGVIDLYRTILAAAGIPDPSPACSFPAADDDSCDLTPYFTNPNPVTPVRPYLYSETSYPNFDPALPAPKPGPSIGQQAIRNKRWKYARTTANENWLFDLQTDQAGNTNLFPPPAASPAAAALDELEAELEELLPGGLLPLCGRFPVGQACTVQSVLSEECCSEVCFGTSLECRNPAPGSHPNCQASSDLFE